MLMIVVSAADHPDLDDWVRGQAEAGARQNGMRLGEYRGREDVLGPNRPPDLCQHIFAAEYRP